MEKGLKKGQEPSILPTCKEWLKINEWKVIPGMIYVREIFRTGTLLQRDILNSYLTYEVLKMKLIFFWNYYSPRLK